MKSIRSLAIVGAVLGLFLCAGTAYAQQTPVPESSEQVNLPDPDAVPADGMDVREYVSNELEPAERDFMRSAVNKLPASTREKILGLDPSKVSITIYDAAAKVAHYNRPEFAGSVEMQPDFDLPGDEFPAELLDADGPDQTGQSPAIDLTQLSAPSCPSSPPPGCYAGSGPYRRIFTGRVPKENVCPDGAPRPCAGKYANTTNFGYWNTGKVSVGCMAGSFIHKKPISEAGFVYLGGWSPNAGTNATGSIVDAGLLYNYELSSKSYDDYSLFLKINGEGALISKSSAVTRIGQPSHIDCEDGASVNLEFRVMPWELNLGQGPGCVSSKGVTDPWELKACGTLALLAQQGVGTYGFQVVVFVAKDITYGGWGHMSSGPTGGGRIQFFPQTPCGGCVFKWMTSIGQKNTGGYKENLTDGSYYSATWENRGIAPWAVPGATGKGGQVLPVPMTTNLTHCAEYPTWTAYNASSIKSDCKNSPAGLTGLSSVISVTNYSVTGETDTISLTKP